MENLRPAREPRRRILKAGKIIFNRTSIIDCTVRNISSGGAALELPSTAGIPSEFILRINGQLDRACEMAWKRAGKIGAKFV